MRQWRLILSGPASGARNMALDEALLLEVAAQPVLRFYSWRPFCLSLGYGQRCRLVEMQRLRARGYTLVRRPSGGGAILHAAELTWSLVLPAGHPLAAGSLSAGYRRIGEVLYAALQSLGIEVGMTQEVTPNPVRSGMLRDSGHSTSLLWADASCSAAPGCSAATVCCSMARSRFPGDVAAICDLLHYPQESARELARTRLRDTGCYPDGCV